MIVHLISSYPCTDQSLVWYAPMHTDVSYVGTPGHTDDVVKLLKITPKNPEK